MTNDEWYALLKAENGHLSIHPGDCTEGLLSALRRRARKDHSRVTMRRFDDNTIHLSIVPMGRTRMKTLVRGLDMTKLVVVADRHDPGCGRGDCSQKENPAHWVDVLPSPQLEEIITELRNFVRAYDRDNEPVHRTVRAGLEGTTVFITHKQAARVRLLLDDNATYADGRQLEGQEIAPIKEET